MDDQQIVEYIEEHINLNDLRNLIKSNPNMTKLKIVIYADYDGGRIDDGISETLASMPLKRLSISMNVLRNQHFKILLQSKSITNLDVGGNVITDDGIIDICNNTTLKTLSLAVTPVTSIGMKELAKSKSITYLSLFNNFYADEDDEKEYVTDDGLKELLTNQVLQTLIISGQPLRGNGLVDIKHNTSLTALDISRTQINDECIKYLLQNYSIIDLNISDTLITADGITELAKTNTIKSLKITENEMAINEVSLKAISDNKSITYLDISNVHLTTISPLTATGLTELAKTNTIQTLKIAGNEKAINEISLKALCDNKNITYLDVSRNRHVFKKHLIDILATSKLKKLLLYGNHLISGDIASLAKNETITNLDLANNQIDNNGAIELAKNKTIKFLDLGSNNIRSKGARALAKNTTLLELSLDNNIISRKSAYMLSRNKNILSLNVKYNLFEITNIDNFMKRNNTILVFSCNVFKYNPIDTKQLTEVESVKYTKNLKTYKDKLTYKINYIMTNPYLVKDINGIIFEYLNETLTLQDEKIVYL